MTKTQIIILAVYAALSAGAFLALKVAQWADMYGLGVSGGQSDS